MPRPQAGSPVDRLHLSSGIATFRKPPTVRPGQAMRVLARGPTEDYGDAMARARAAPWWPQVVNRKAPYSTAAKWVFIITTEGP